MLKAYKIVLEGIVQGVGFRPFVKRLAQRFGVVGFIRNTAKGVEIHAEATSAQLKKFWQALFTDLPVLARINSFNKTSCLAWGFNEFRIQESRYGKHIHTLISPDISICNACLKELFDPLNRRFLYPFINCTDCGPRFSIILSLPYDRPRTTMHKFTMCKCCNKEYLDIHDRRFHAQPNACGICGPDVQLLSSEKEKILETGTSAIKLTIQLLKKGKIVAIKGIGGFHIACDAFNYQAISRLRQLKNRPAKPFALMVADIKAVKSFCNVSDLEEKLLNSPERPIVLLRKKKGNLQSQIISPDNNYLGVMLAYSGLHYLLFSKELSVGKPLSCLVMTSGNIQDEPLEIENISAYKNLRKMCDYFLMHNRDIENRLDDSIIQVIDRKAIVLRRGRGYAPFPFFLTKQTVTPILACGAELKNTVCLVKNKFAFVSQYLGDLKTQKTYLFFEETINKLSKLFFINPKVIIHDLHPDYLSTSYAISKKKQNSSLKLMAVQHHQAHLASVIAEHRIKEAVIGICFDGIGLGTDGHIWGGEFFIGKINKFTRKAHLEYVAMPGQDKATKEPYRMAISYLEKSFGDEIFNLKIPFIKKHQKVLKSIVGICRNQGILTSSAGRLFDAVSALLGLCDIITYEAQAAIRLQMFAERFTRSTNKKFYPMQLYKKGSAWIISSIPLFKAIVQDILQNKPTEEIAYCFHLGLAKACLEVCAILRKETNIKTICLSGGVFQNKLFLEILTNHLRQKKFLVYYNELLPSNDGAISLGQAAIALATRDKNYVSCYTC
ncbi:MAG: carbamoyltransferase HypF [Candidatus Omnitrophica bacterium]|nr:carbamoyltransferase HypF [Candidatus Omnitrophota bacterium]